MSTGNGSTAKDLLKAAKVMVETADKYEQQAAFHRKNANQLLSSALQLLSMDEPSPAAAPTKKSEQGDLFTSKPAPQPKPKAQKRGRPTGNAMTCEGKVLKVLALTETPIGRMAVLKRAKLNSAEQTSNLLSRAKRQGHVHNEDQMYSLTPKGRKRLTELEKKYG